METTTVENTTVAYASQDRFIELSHKWHDEFGDMKLEKFFNTEDKETTPLMQQKRFVVSQTIAHFLRSNGVYPGSFNTFTFMYACDEPEAYAEKCPTFNTEELEDDNFDYSTVYGDEETDDCACF